jgi:hypothetical protein
MKKRQHIGQMKNDKRTNDPQNITQQTKDRVKRTPLKTRVLRLGFQIFWL